jgi:hypothetical protein
MKYVITICLLFSILSFYYCRQTKDPVKGWLEISKESAVGHFKTAKHMADSMKLAFPGDTLLVNRLDSLTEMNRRISLDFSLSEEEIQLRLQKIMGDFTPEQKLAWETGKLLEFRMIDGEKRYFNRAASNLKLLLTHQEKKKTGALLSTPDETAAFRIKEAQEAIRNSPTGKPSTPKPVKIHYTIKVDSGAVPKGEMIRCWMPFPKEGHQRQQQISLLRTYPENHLIAPDSAGQRSLFMEQTSAGDQPTVFELELTYSPSAQYFDLKTMSLQPYRIDSPLFLKYTSEEKPHIVFTEKIRKLSDSIIGKETNPVEKVRKIYYWIDENIPWAGALEYSIMPNIPEYVIDNRHGDCGMQTLLFMTLARYNGIPVKWQSGWMVPPGEVNLHDWCEVYYDGAGWVPLDMSYGLLPSENQQIKEYYMTGIDAWRLIVNDATGSPFIPAKKYIRSEPVDFQRGELEWKGGNLYFDKWDYTMEVEYLK